MNNETRKNAIEAALLAYQQAGEKRTETIEYRGQLKSFEVIRINASIPLLNNNNSRLRAQISTHPQREIVYSDPFSSAAQEILSELLAQTDKFGDLRRELKELGQKNPGIITRDGMLVNGNTRLVATKLNGDEGFDVAVLPQDATSDDFLDIEMSLQLRNLVHQDYTFTNRLLLVDNLIRRSANDAAVIKSMHWQRNGQTKLALHRRLLALVEEIRSSTETQLDYKFFDGKEEMLKNLDMAYQAALQESPRSAEELKWARITAMVLGLNKDEVRAIDTDFVENSLQPRVEGTEAETFLNSFRPETVSDELDELLASNESLTTTSYDLRKVAEKIISTGIDESGTISIDKIEVFSKLHNAMKTGARDLIESDVAEKMRSEPIEYLREVTLKVEELTNSLPALFKDAEFNKTKFEFQAKKTQKSIQALQAELDRQLGTK